ncbi:hypothetical protein CDAR_14241 [Caerostris darwini]|uniref:Secreted protein n=1 Tax=Caerostris darwini TaxID=1538125 RepID=A0AAV4QCF7_9ARAC|nr:hypothetical protein CDAR_14241 [Caerostris darwini]
MPSCLSRSLVSPLRISIVLVHLQLDSAGNTLRSLEKDDSGAAFISSPLAARFCREHFEKSGERRNRGSIHVRILVPLARDTHGFGSVYLCPPHSTTVYYSCAHWCKCFPV